MQGRFLFLFAVLVGILSYSIFFLGFLSGINSSVLLVLLIFFFLTLAVLVYVHRGNVLLALRAIGEQSTLVTIFSLFIGVNLIGALGPELGFDALWYHLTIPKIFIESGRVEFISGGLLYYSVMPKLIDMLYIPAILFESETSAKIIHLVFGVLTSAVTYLIARQYLNKKLSILTALLFYSNLVVGWMSITAYIDLGRAFFATTAVYFFLLYFKLNKLMYLFFAFVIVGLEISTKFLGLSTLISLLLVLLIYDKSGYVSKIYKSALFALLSISIVLPWLFFSYLYTKNFFYPFFTDIYPSEINILSFDLVAIVSDTIRLFMISPDPISPIYIMAAPLIVIFYKTMPKGIRITLFIFVINLLLWNFIPQKNSRFILPYLPLLSIVVIWAVSSVRDVNYRKIFYFFIYLSFLVNLIYRGIANYKYIPVLFGFQSKEEFLLENLNFEFGDYIDGDDEVKKRVGDNKVLIYGIHNLYYVDFEYDHESWGRDHKEYRYVLVNDEYDLNLKYNLIYEDRSTNTKLYEKN